MNFFDVTSRSCSSQSSHLTNDARKKLRSERVVDDLLSDWLDWLIICLPFNTLVRVIDCFMVEGKKFLFRTSLAILLLYSTRHPGSRSVSPEGIKEICGALTPDQLILSAIQIKNLSRKTISRQYQKADSIGKLTPPRKHSGSTGSYSSEGSNGTVPSTPERRIPPPRDMLENVILSKRIAPLDFSSSILDWSLLDMIWDEIPERVTILEPRVVFCSDVHGNSLQTLYQMASNYEVTLLVVQTVEDQVNIDLSLH